MCHSHSNHHSKTGYSRKYIEKELTRWYWRFVYDRLTREKRRYYQKCLKNGYSDNTDITLKEIKGLLERSYLAKRNFLFWKKIAKKENLYYQTLGNYKSQKPNPLYHDKAFFKKLPSFML